MWWGEKKTERQRMTDKTKRLEKYKPKLFFYAACLLSWKYGPSSRDKSWKRGGGVR